LYFDHAQQICIRRILIYKIRIRRKWITAGSVISLFCLLF